MLKNHNLNAQNSALPFDASSNAQVEPSRQSVTLNDDNYYYPPANATMVQVVSGTAWVSVGKSNIYLYAGDRLDLTAIPGPACITSYGKRHVMIEVFFAS